MESQLSVAQMATSMQAPVKEKKSKSKKHKKHHRHDKYDTMAAADPMSGNPGALKIRIKMGGEESASSGHKKKKKKDKKKKDKEKKHRHHHKEKRKREQQHQDLEGAENQGEIMMEPPIKRITFDRSVQENPTEMEEDEVKPMEIVEEEPESREQAEVRAAREAGKRQPLYKLLDYILPLLEKRDSKHFFALPVTDKFAPGYSQIITKPMDFSTMRTKLDNGEYVSMEVFKSDFELMCTNAMTYNTQDTVYYKTAKKLLQIGQKLLTPKKLILLREQMPFMESLTIDEIGFDILGEIKDEDLEEDDEDDDDSKDVSRVLEDIKEVVRRPPGRFEAIPDDLTSQEILDQARKAAAAAADRLKLYKPRSRLGFLRQKDDGSTSLSFLTGGEGLVPGTEKDRPVSLGALIGKVKQGTGAIQGFREDRRNLVKPIHPLYYGAFSSHGPNYDSTFANLTKEESDLVYSTYGDEVGVQYAESILNYAKNCDYAMSIVDHMLEILTGDHEHVKTSRYIEEQKTVRKENQLLDMAFQQPNEREGSEAAHQPASLNECDDNEVKVEDCLEERKSEGEDIKVNFDSLKSLAEEGIDMSFLDSLKSQYDATAQKEEKVLTPEQQLNQTAQLLQQLKDTQTERLNQTPPQHFAHIAKPGVKELELAEKIQHNLIGITKQIRPKEVVPLESVKVMLGLPSDKLDH